MEHLEEPERNLKEARETAVYLMDQAPKAFLGRELGAFNELLVRLEAAQRHIRGKN